MKRKQLDMPILFVAFNRPWAVKKTFNEIRKARPKKLYISVDGPRNEEENKKVEEVRKIVSKVDWDCKVKKIFYDKNQGIKEAFCNAMEMMFENEEYGIIIEDDVVTSEAFFDFCDKMLKIYKDDERVMHVSGTNLECVSNIKENYFFSDMVFNFWGWGTWRRAWKYHDKDLKIWPKVKFKFFFKQCFKEGLLVALRSYRIYQRVYKGKIQTADYQWDLDCRLQKGVCIIPKYNLVKNIGFREDSTHTTEINVSIPMQRKFPMKNLQEQEIKINKKYNKFYFNYFTKQSLKRFLKKLNFFSKSK